MPKLPPYIEEFEIKVKANYKVIQIISFEWLRIHGIVITVARDLGRDVYHWTNTDGIRKWDFNESQFTDFHKDLDNPIPALQWFINNTEANNSIMIMEDLHTYFDSVDIREIITLIKKVNRIAAEKTLVLSQPIYRLPRELEKDVFIMELPLPDVDVLERVIEKLVSDGAIPPEQAPREDWEYVARAALGLTVMEAELTFREAYERKGRLDRSAIPIIISRKEEIIRKSGILEYYHPRESFKDVGGLEILKEWIKIRKKGFEPDAEEFGLSPPRGVLLLGIPGCGKSLVAKTIAAEWGLPLLRLDLGRIFGSLVGESEANIRRALAVAEAIAPCVLWIDEIEKGLAGVSSSEFTDAGVTARVFGTLLTWMQEKEKPVFVVATANRVDQLPPELLRKGRFDEIFFVDIPGSNARREIWLIHLGKRLKSRLDKLLKEGEINIDRLVEISKGYTGAEIEEAINEALYRAYYEDREVKMADFERSLKEIYPLSKIMGEQLLRLREWAKARVKLASKEEPELIEETEEKRKVPKLRQEVTNPFIY